VSNSASDEQTEKIRQLRSRWADQRRSQFGITIALLTSLSGAGLGFCASLIAGSAALGGIRTEWLLATALGFGIALILGILATFTRLLDFRLTASIPDKRLARKKSKRFGFLSIPATRWWCSALGRLTWSFTWIQLFSLLAGIGCAAMTAYHVYHQRLFP